MRKFYLENSIGERRDLQTKQEIHLREPAGLGWADNNTYADARGFFPRTDSRPVQPAVTGDFVIAGYANYKALADWIHQGYELTLVYDPSGTEYRIDIDILSLQKGEINAWGRLECPFAMAAKTPWYLPITKEFVISPPDPTANYKEYPYEYTFEYAVGLLEASVEIRAGGHLPATIRMTCPGILVNPIIILSGQHGEIGRMVLDNISIAEGETLLYSTKFGQTGVWRDGDDLLEYLDLTNNNFFEIPCGENCTLKIESEAALTSNVTIELFEYYRSV